jgi:hypothetical protein
MIWFGDTARVTQLFSSQPSKQKIVFQQGPSTVPVLFMLRCIVSMM